MKKAFILLLIMVLFLTGCNEVEKESSVDPQARDKKIVELASTVKLGRYEENIIKERANAWIDSNDSDTFIVDDNFKSEVLYDWQHNSELSKTYINNLVVKLNQVRIYKTGSYVGDLGQSYHAESNQSGLYVVDEGNLRDTSMSYIGIDLSKKEYREGTYFDYIPQLDGYHVIPRNQDTKKDSIEFKEGITNVTKYKDTYIVEGKAVVNQGSADVKTYLFLNKDKGGNFSVMWGFIE